MKRLKKLISVVCVLSVLLLCLAGCSSSNPSEEKGSDSLASRETGQQESNDVKTGEGSAAVNSTEQPSAENQAENQNTEPVSGTDGKVLVAYFSATGTTKTLAEYAADALGADLYEIVPEEPYTSADLDYGNSSSRSSLEMNDSTSRPAISGSVEDMAQYDIIFLGYPIWWGEAPRIVDTFMESYDFSGKTIVPFCTSASSGIGSSARNLHDLCAEDVTWLDGARLGSSSSHEDMVEWINSLGLDVEAK